MATDPGARCYPHDHALLQWLEENYRLEDSKGYVEQDPLYRQVKAALLHRESYRYKAVLQLFVPAQYVGGNWTDSRTSDPRIPGPS